MIIRRYNESALGDLDLDLVKDLFNDVVDEIGISFQIEFGVFGSNRFELLDNDPGRIESCGYKIEFDFDCDTSKIEPSESETIVDLLVSINSVIRRIEKFNCSCFITLFDSESAKLQVFIQKLDLNDSDYYKIFTGIFEQFYNCCSD